MNKYKKKYAAELIAGLRIDGASDVECCLLWNVLYSEYKSWVKDIPEFAIAHEFGEMQASAYWYNMAKSLASKGNASVLTAGMKNIGVNNWVDKKADDAIQEEPIRAIEIRILPPRVD